MSKEPLVSINRRSFLKGLGATSAVSVTACASDQAQTIYSLVKGENEAIPGVAVWYSSTCTECTAGCGIQVRTREGRAVKVEGDPRNPINRGGLCALGQASLQHLYDPDRIRQPLKRVSGVGSTAKFEPISWAEALAQVGEALKTSQADGKRRAFITGEVSGAFEELLRELSDNFEMDHAAYDVLQPLALAKASELVYGVYGVPEYSFDKAEVVLNFGADFLETWVSPVQFARQWADSRRSAKPVRVIQVEPRLSLSGANADLWLMNNPGTEVRLALAILKILLDAGRGANLAPDVRQSLLEMVRGVSVAAVAAETGVPEEKIALVGHYLTQANRSLVIAGGAAAATSSALQLHVVVNFINSLLENVGHTVNLNRVRSPRTSLSAMQKLISSMDAQTVSLAFIHGSNPAFTLPADYGFEYAIRKVPLVVSFSSHLDETSKNANLILPTNTALESWGDVRPYAGVYSLLQPSMTPVFDTKELGDVLIALAKTAGKPITGARIALRGASATSVAIEDFRAFLQESWKQIAKKHRTATEFPVFWNECVEAGGFYAIEESSAVDRVRTRVDRTVFSLVYTAATFATSLDESVKGTELVVFPYPSVKTFDGRAANRPWLQELPDPISQLVWDSWGELNPETAKSLGVAQGDLLTVRNSYGEVNVPVLVSPYVQRGVVAIPLGQGHQGYGRFAQQVTSGNVMSLLARGQHSDGSVEGSSDLPSSLEAGVALVSMRARAFRAPGRAMLVKQMGSDSQHNRDIARTRLITEGASGDLETTGHDASEHDHEIKQMYTQREHPLYQWGMTVDLAACTGCSACIVACYAENNIPVVGKQRSYEGREMSWLRIERYYDNATFDNRSELPPPEELSVSFIPMMCQHCHNAPCEPVCPVYATYHNEEGLNAMIYNRCVGTRYCSNNCAYKVRRFNWYDYEFPDTLNWQLNPDVTKRTVGIMEKCTFCVQRIVEAKDHAKDEGRMVRDGEVQPACVQSCPTQALTFGNLHDKKSAVVKKRDTVRAYKVLDYYVNTQPAVSYLERLRYSKS